jgi:hypothetical protein
MVGITFLGPRMHHLVHALFSHELARFSWNFSSLGLGIDSRVLVRQFGCNMCKKRTGQAEIGQEIENGGHLGEKSKERKEKLFV